LRLRGLVNVQYVVHRGHVYVLEVNPRSSRTVPFLSKVTGVPMVKLATGVMLGEKLADLGWATGLVPPRDLVAVKAPVFSMNKLPNIYEEPGDGNPVFKDGFEIRRAAVERRIPCLTSLDTATALLESAVAAPDEMEVRTIGEWRELVPA